jgi:hypothetical protein
MPETELSTWITKVRRACKKIKLNEMDDYDTDFIDIDALLGMYIEEFKAYKRENTKKLQNKFMKLTKTSASFSDMTDEAA